MDSFYSETTNRYHAQLPFYSDVGTTVTTPTTIEFRPELLVGTVIVKDKKNSHQSIMNHDSYCKGTDKVPSPS